MRAFTFKALTQVLKCAGDKKLKEVQLCLEGLLISIPYSVCCAYRNILMLNFMTTAHHTLEHILQWLPADLSMTTT